MRGDSNRFDLPSPCPDSGDSRDERDLQRADYLAVLHGDYKVLVRIRQVQAEIEVTEVAE